MEQNLLEMHKKHLTNLMHEKKITNINDLDKEFIFAYTYDAISLEGKNKIPYESVRRIIEVGMIPNFSEREQKEVLNHVLAYEKILSYLKNDKDLEEEDIKDIHEVLMTGICGGGVYRNVNIQITGAAHQPPDYVKVYDRMKKTFEIADAMKSSVDKGIFLQAQISKIHPFLDGNGRLARLILNYYLLKNGYIPISIRLDYRDDYFKNIERYKIEKDIKPITNFIKRLLNERYDLLIRELDK